MLLALCTSCNDDDYHYPNVVTDLVEIDTDSQDNIQVVRTDEGEELTPAKKVVFSQATPDSTYRMRCSYQLLENGTAELYSLNQVLSPKPFLRSLLKKEIVQDPLNLISAWSSGHYLNLHLGVMSKNGAQLFQMVYEGKARNRASGTTHSFTLWHEQNKDPEAFTREVFFSTPLKDLDIQQGDSLLLSLNTYQGKQQISMIYK